MSEQSTIKSRRIFFKRAGKTGLVIGLLLSAIVTGNMVSADNTISEQLAVISAYYRGAGTSERVRICLGMIHINEDFVSRSVREFVLYGSLSGDPVLEKMMMDSLACDVKKCMELRTLWPTNWPAPPWKQPHDPGRFHARMVGTKLEIIQAGILVTDCTPMGVMVSKIDRNSPADSAGLERSSLIYEINGMRIYCLLDVEGAVDASPKSMKVRFIKASDRNAGRKVSNVHTFNIK